MRKYSAKLSRSDKNWSTVTKKGKQRKKRKNEMDAIVIRLSVVANDSISIFLFTREMITHFTMIQFLGAIPDSKRLFFFTQQKIFRQKKPRHIKDTYKYLYIDTHMWIRCERIDSWCFKLWEEEKERKQSFSRND